MSNPCRSPEKQKHRSFNTAIKARDSLEAVDGVDLALRPYRCGDHWHLGHHDKPYGKRAITAALIRGKKNSRASRRRRTR